MRGSKEAKGFLGMRIVDFGLGIEGRAPGLAKNQY